MVITTLLTPCPYDKYLTLHNLDGTPYFMVHCNTVVSNTQKTEQKSTSFTIYKSKSTWLGRKIAPGLFITILTALYVLKTFFYALKQFRNKFYAKKNSKHPQARFGYWKKTIFSTVKNFSF